MNTPRLFVLQVAALGHGLVERHGWTLDGMAWRAAAPVFPAVTCTAQASLRTAVTPAVHGMVSNGRYFRDLARVLFWEQSARLVEGPRTWDAFRAAGKRVGMMFWQQSLGEAVDLVLSPKPIHKHGGGLVQHCYGKPDSLYGELTREIGRPFNLFRYWGPMAGQASSDWIVDALVAVMRNPSLAPDVLFGYLPHLDYDLQKWGPDDPRIAGTVTVARAQVQRAVDGAREAGYDVLITGDYAIGPVTGGAIFVNRVLREHGWFDVIRAKGRTYPDFFNSAAFAMSDHEVAHVYLGNRGDRDAVGRALTAIPGVEHVLDEEGKRAWGIDHAAAGDFVLVAEAGSWFAYPWWEEPAEAPDFATHIDIHNKPGFDPCELFWGWPPPAISRNPARVRGTHGRTDSGRDIAWATTCDWRDQPESVIEIAAAIRAWLVQIDSAGAF